MVCLLVAGCDAYIVTIMSEFHQAASVACEKNGGYQYYKAWETQGNVLEDQRLAIVCNDQAEIYIQRTAAEVDGEWIWTEWKSDHLRYGKI
jgi:hypothetical protein